MYVWRSLVSCEVGLEMYGSMVVVFCISRLVMKDCSAGSRTMMP